jgi:hypothetical protein
VFLFQTAFDFGACDTSECRFHAQFPNRGQNRLLPASCAGNPGNRGGVAVPLNDL